MRTQKNLPLLYLFIMTVLKEKVRKEKTLDARSRESNGRQKLMESQHHK
jgi:hypothetical protein